MTTNKIVLPFQVFKAVDGRMYPSAELNVSSQKIHNQIVSFAKPNLAREALGGLLAYMLDAGAREGFRLWDRAWVEGDMSMGALPAGFPEIIFYGPSATPQPALKICPRTNKGAWASPLNDEWQIISSEPALPSGWKPSAYAKGPLKAMINYARAHYGLDLDCESVTFSGMDRDVVKALVSVDYL